MLYGPIHGFLNILSLKLQPHHILGTEAAKHEGSDRDTDEYNIGLTLIDPSVHDVYVQLSNISSPELRLLHLKQLLHTFRNDSDLSLGTQPLIPCVIQTYFQMQSGF